MPKRVFWPIALVVLGIVLLASYVGMMPASMLNLWPLILIIVGLGGLLISDKEEWNTPEQKKARPARSVAKTTTAKAAPRKKASKAKKRA